MLNDPESNAMEVRGNRSKNLCKAGCNEEWLLTEKKRGEMGQFYLMLQKDQDTRGGAEEGYCLSPKNLTKGQMKSLSRKPQQENLVA